MIEQQESPNNEGVRPVFYDLADRVQAFGVQDYFLLDSILNHFVWAVNNPHRLIADKENADELLALAVHHMRRDRFDMTAEQYYELERWIDFLGAAYHKIWWHMEKPRRGRRPKNVTDGQLHKLFYFPKHPSEMPDFLPDWSTIPCVVGEDGAE